MGYARGRVALPQCAMTESVVRWRGADKQPLSLVVRGGSPSDEPGSRPLLPQAERSLIAGLHEHEQLHSNERRYDDKSPANHPVAPGICEVIPGMGAGR